MADVVTLSKKICLLGSFGVGKTSLVRRFVHQTFEENYHSTIGVQLSQRLIALDEKAQFNLIIWDLAHIEKYDNVLKRYLHGAHGAILVFDVSRPETLEALTPMRCFFHENSKGAPCLAAANKYDLLEKDAVDFDTISRNVEALNVRCVYTSAKTDHQVDMTFRTLCSMF
ncbi:GTP-binding protein [bacterium]|nr:GTP-binding protein [bacterium]